VSDSPPEHLSLILDLSPTQWHLSSLDTNPQPLSLRLFISQVLVFLNAHLASRHDNTIAVLAALPGKNVMIYSSSDNVEDSDHLSPLDDSNTYQPFKAMNSAVVQRIDEELGAQEHEETEAPIGLVGALTKALCHINRLTHPAASANPSIAVPTPPSPRILIFSVSPDLSTAYIPLMNSIFSAQKLKVAIDVCKLYGEDTVFLQQVAHLTGGLYVNPERRDALLQYLAMCFLPSTAIRRVLGMPTQDHVDFRAACFCHKNIIDIGYICSVCLSIFCSPVPVCSTCRTKFPIKTLQRLMLSRPSPLSNGHQRTASPR